MDPKHVLMSEKSDSTPMRPTHAMIHHLNSEVSGVKSSLKYLSALLLLLIVVCAALFGVMIGAIEVTKEYHVQKDTTVMTSAADSDSPLATQEYLNTAGIAELLFLDDDAIDEVKTVKLYSKAGAVENVHMYQVMSYSKYGKTRLVLYTARGDVIIIRQKSDGIVTTTIQTAAEAAAASAKSAAAIKSGSARRSLLQSNSMSGSSGSPGSGSPGSGSPGSGSQGSGPSGSGSSAGCCAPVVGSTLTEAQCAAYTPDVLKCGTESGGQCDYSSEPCPPPPAPEGCCVPIDGSGATLAECAAINDEGGCKTYKEGAMCEWSMDCAPPPPEPTGPQCCLPVEGSGATNAECAAVTPLGEVRCLEYLSGGMCYWGDCGEPPREPPPPPTAEPPIGSIDWSPIGDSKDTIPKWNPCCTTPPTEESCPTQFCRWSPEIPKCSHIGGELSNPCPDEPPMEPSPFAKGFRAKMLTTSKSAQLFSKRRVSHIKFRGKK